MKAQGFPKVIWAMLGLLGVAAFLLTLGKQELTTQPLSSSYAPSGTAAFVDLLRHRGFTVVADRRIRPHLGPKDVAIGFRIWPEARSLNEEKDPSVEALEEFAEKGGRVVWLHMSRDFQDESRARLKSGPIPVYDAGSQTEHEIFASEEESDFSGGGKNPSIQLWGTEDSDFVRGTRVGKGTIFDVADGLLITNRFIDRADDAAVASKILGSVVPDGGRIVLAEATAGNGRSTGLLESIGSWAEASWYQLIFFGVVVIYTLGRRFGLAEPIPVRQKGARELLDAIADTYLRGRHAKVALATAVQSVERELRTSLRIARDADLALRDDRLPAALQRALAEGHAALEPPKLAPDHALTLIQRLEAAHQEFSPRKRPAAVEGQ